MLKLVLRALGATAVIGLTAEALQSAAEYGQLVADPVFGGAGVARGDGHPVMVIPGFSATTAILKRCADGCGASATRRWPRG